MFTEFFLFHAERFVGDWRMGDNDREKLADLFASITLQLWEKQLENETYNEIIYSGN